MLRIIVVSILGVALSACSGPSGLPTSGGAAAELRQAANTSEDPESVLTFNASNITDISAMSTKNEYLYVANSANNSITVYGRMANGNVAPKRSIVGPHTQITCIQQIAIGADGFVYVASLSALPYSGAACNFYERGNVLVFAPGAEGDVAPVRIVGGPASAIQNPSAVAVATDGTLYVGSIDAPDTQLPYYHSTILAFDRRAKGGAPPTSTQTLDGLASIEDLALTRSSIIVSFEGRNQGASSYVALPLGSAPEILGVEGADLSSIAYDPATNTFLAHGDGLTHDIVRLAYGTVGHFASPSSQSTVLPSIISSLNTPCASGLAIGPEREFYVGTCTNEIEAFLPGASGSTVPIRTMSGSETMLADSTSIAVGASP